MSLQRFEDAHRQDYETALAEIRRGRKTSHWMWYIFPQLKGLGHSPTAQYYSIENLAEAEAFLASFSQPMQPGLRRNPLRPAAAAKRLRMKRKRLRDAVKRIPLPVRRKTLNKRMSL